MFFSFNLFFSDPLSFLSFLSYNMSVKFNLFLLISFLLFFLLWWWRYDYLELERKQIDFIPEVPKTFINFDSSYRLKNIITKNFDGGIYHRKNYWPLYDFNYPWKEKSLSSFDGKSYLWQGSNTFLAWWGEEYSIDIPTSWLQDYEFIAYNHLGVDLQLCFRGVNMLPFWKDQEQLLPFWKRGCEKISTGTFLAIKNIDMQQLEKFDYLQARIKPLGYVDTLITLVLRKNDNL